MPCVQRTSPLAASYARTTPTLRSPSAARSPATTSVSSPTTGPNAPNPTSSAQRVLAGRRRGRRPPDPGPAEPCGDDRPGQTRRTPPVRGDSTPAVAGDRRGSRPGDDDVVGADDRPEAWLSRRVRGGRDFRRRRRLAWRFGVRVVGGAFGIVPAERPRARLRRPSIERRVRGAAGQPVRAVRAAEETAAGDGGVGRRRPRSKAGWCRWRSVYARKTCRGRSASTSRPHETVSANSSERKKPIASSWERH